MLVNILSELKTSISNEWSHSSLYHVYRSACTKIGKRAVIHICKQVSKQSSMSKAYRLFLCFYNIAIGIWNFLIWLLWCLFFFDLRILIIPKVSSNSSYTILDWFSTCLFTSTSSGSVLFQACGKVVNDWVAIETPQKIIKISSRTDKILYIFLFVYVEHE